MHERNARRATGLPVSLILVLVILVGLNLRSTFGVVPPLLGEISAELHLGATVASLLTAVPVLFMGLAAPRMPQLASRVSPEGALSLMIGVLAVGSLLRLFVGSTWSLLATAVLIGIGMGGCSALMPHLIARHLSRIPGTATGIYSTSMAIGVALAAMAAGPLAAVAGWRVALASTGVLAGLVGLLWTALLPRLATAPTPLPSGGRRIRLPWRNRTAWLVCAYTALNMLTGFSGVAWLAPTMLSQGVPAPLAATMFAAFQLIQLVAMLTLPPLTDVTTDRRPLLAVTAGCTLLGVLCMALAPQTLAWPGTLLFGVGVGGSASMSLVLVQDVSTTPADAGRLGAMSMLVAYVLGAVGPLLLGVLRDLTGGFTAGYLSLVVICVGGLAVIPALRPGRTLMS
ncbi:MAG: CynX/NimT family MFS transporter [Actinomycetales bacterium]